MFSEGVMLLFLSGCNQVFFHDADMRNSKHDWAAEALYNQEATFFEFMV